MYELINEVMADFSIASQKQLLPVFSIKTGSSCYMLYDCTLLHLEVECSTCHNLLVGEFEVCDGLAIKLDLLYIDAFVGLVGCIDDKVLSTCKVQGCFLVEWGTDDIFCRAGVEGVEAESREDVPC